MTPNVVTPERAKEIEQRLATAKTRILFDGPPSHESGRFVEVEDEHGRSFGAGEWTEQGEFWVLTLTSPRVQAEDLRDLLHTLAVEREENARLRVESEKLTELTKGFVTAIKWWAAQEDGIPEEVAPAFVGGMFVLGWEFSTNHDLQALAALAPRGEEGK